MGTRDFNLDINAMSVLFHTHSLPGCVWYCRVFRPDREKAIEGYPEEDEEDRHLTKWFQ